MARELAFETTTEAERGESEPAFLVDVDGFEGPLDLLLELARRQKVDLARISILALAEQYLEFIEAARRVRLELAADYLVMAAWLAYLKSRLLLPEPPKGEEPSAADLASALADRLRRLEAIRRAADALTERARLGRDMFLRGAGEGLETTSSTRFRANLFDLLSAYARQRAERRDLEGHAAPAQRLVAGRSAGGVGTTRRSGAGMDRAGRFPDTVLRRSDDRAHGAGVRLFGLAGDGPRGAFPYAAGSRFFANLGHAPGASRGGGRVQRRVVTSSERVIIYRQREERIGAGR